MTFRPGLNSAKTEPHEPSLLHWRLGSSSPEKTLFRPGHYQLPSQCLIASAHVSYISLLCTPDTHSARASLAGSLLNCRFDSLIFSSPWSRWMRHGRLHGSSRCLGRRIPLRLRRHGARGRMTQTCLLRRLHAGALRRRETRPLTCLSHWRRHLRTSHRRGHAWPLAHRRCTWCLCGLRRRGSPALAHSGRWGSSSPLARHPWWHRLHWRGGWQGAWVLRVGGSRRWRYCGSGWNRIR